MIIGEYSIDSTVIDKEYVSEILSKEKLKGDSLPDIFIINQIGVLAYDPCTLVINGNMVLSLDKNEVFGTENNDIDIFSIKFDTADSRVKIRYCY